MGVASNRLSKKIVYASRVPPRWPRTSNVRLLLELRSDRRETSAMRVSDDLQISIFLRHFFLETNLDFFFGFSLFSADFRRARLFLTSKSSSSRFFALYGQNFRSVRRFGLIFRFFTVRTSTCGGKARVTEIPRGRSPPDPPWGARHGQRRFLMGASPPRSPHDTISKNLPFRGKFFEMIKTAPPTQTVSPKAETMGGVIDEIALMLPCGRKLVPTKFAYRVP